MKEKEDIKKDVDTAVDEETQATEETTEIPVEDEKTDLEKANEKMEDTCLSISMTMEIQDISIAGD